MSSIWLCGSSGTGKSTTGKILAKKLGLDLIDGVSRNSPFEMHTLDHQQYMSRIIFNIRHRRNFVSCRSPADVLAYSIGFGINNLEMDKAHSDIFFKSKPILIYFPFGMFPIENDKFRPTDLNLNQIVDFEIQKQIKETNLNFYTVGKESAEERAKKIINYLERNGKI